MEVKAGYKQTEVGVIPKDWEIKLLPDICRFRGGKAHEQHISDFGRFVCVNSKFISTNGCVRKYSTVNFCCAKRNDVLMVMSDLPNGKALAKAFLADQDNLYAVNQRVCALTPYRDCPKYLFYVLNRNPYFLGFDDGVNQTHLLNPVFQKCLLSLPPTKAEQEAIAEALSDANALIESLDQLLAKKRHIKQGAMQELLTGKKRLPGFSGEWEVKRLGEILTVCHGKSQSDVEATDGQYPILASGGEIGRANRFLYDKPSVLIGRKGTIDQPQYMDTPFWTVDTLFYSVVHEPNHAKFMFYRFCLIDWKQHNEASGVPSLNARTIEKIEISSPAPDEQSAIAAILSDMDVSIGALEAKLSKTRQLKQGMMQELLTGRIRLV
ncbi:MAG: restriction endonuclease subunit S [Candidatus Eisenbacteria bacterium]|uniref:Restriction endonuclease subunit S n=1 Tax=Eiseniibacteriota bacterium TaxID=2212470 RepID=A0A948RYE6_UNCEI|nr:restriction endonuclease subunit S [Candidatus Eisenbacteria bacterium]MBU2693135.1 restriction endonuclease subunit S [Candidatus Eisenbacteria bacterium]